MRSLRGIEQVSHAADTTRHLDRQQLEAPRPGFQQQFEFVEGLKSKAERKKTRSWVTTQHYRRKRYESGKAGEEHAAGSQGTRARHAQPPSSPSNSDAEGAAEQKQKQREGQQESEQVVCLNPGSEDSGLVQSLGGGRTDPFDSYPIPATRDVHELVDHYYFVIPSLIHRHWSRAVRRPRSCWDLFNLYRMHEIPFLGMLHHAAHHLAGLRGNVMSLQTMEFKQRTLVAVNQSLQKLQGQPCDDWTIIGVGLLANAERVWGDREVARMHWGAVKRLLLERGGFRALQNNPPMHTKLVWSFIALSWPTANGNPAYVDGFIESAASASIPLAHNAKSAFQRSCVEFVQFFNRRRTQTLANLPSTPAQQRRLRSHHYRATTFHADSDLAKALNKIETGYESRDKRRAVDNCRMACLIHLNLVLAEHGDFSTATEDYLTALHRILQDDDDDSSLSSEHLLWTLLTAFKPDGHYERVWKMSRVVGVVKTTNSQTWAMLETALRAFLRLPESIEGLEEILSRWDQERFLREIIDGTTTIEMDTSSLGLRQMGVEYQHDEFPCSEGCQICPLKPPSF